MATVKAIHQTSTGKNDLFIKHDSSGKTPVSKPNGNKKDNLE